MINVFKLSTVESDFEGFSHLINLAHQMEALQYSHITLDFKEVRWFSANMCAPLGAILYRTSRRLNTVRLVNIPPDVESILAKNGFLGNYGRPLLQDIWSTTIQYSRFEQKDDRYFADYIQKHFASKAIPVMSDNLRKKFWESIFEIFSNAVIHSETQLGIFSCGQYFPRKNQIWFSVADLGIGMRRKLATSRNLIKPAEEAIMWAMEGRNTTKTGPIPGGLGLKLLREFIRLNQGRIEVVSDSGYWEQRPDGSNYMKPFSAVFPGTVVNIEINTADEN